MITREEIENYAENQGERCLEVFAMREEFLAEKYKKDTAKSYLDRYIQYLSKESKGLPLDKARRVEYLLGEYDLETLMLKFGRVSERVAKNPVRILANFLFGGVILKTFTYLTDLEVEGLSAEEKQGIVDGLVLISLWDAAS